MRMLNNKKLSINLIILLVMMVASIGCSNKEMKINQNNLEETEINEEIEINKENKDTKMDLTYSTKFGDVNAITYPSFTFDYSTKWELSQSVTSDMEEVILTNPRGVQIIYTNYLLPEDFKFSGNKLKMLRVNVTDEADSKFIPSYVQGTDHSNLGEFMVAKLKVTGELNMQTDSDFKDIDGDVSYALLPKSRIGIVDGVTGSFDTEFSFWYSGHISFISSSPDGLYTEDEKKEIIEILSSFRCVEN